MSRFRLTNLSGAPVRLNHYSYVDFDMYGTQNSAQGLSTFMARYHRLTSSTSVTDFVEHFGYGADGDAVLPFATLRAAILAGCPDYATSPFSPGGQIGPADYTGAFQWKDRMIPSGTSFEVWVGFAHNVSVRTCPAALATAYGAASGSGSGILLGTSSVLGDLLSYEILGGAAAANQPWVIFFGLNQISLPISGLVILNTLDLFSVSLTLDANGAGVGYLPVPYLPVVCGAAMHAQTIYIDPSSPIGIPVSATQGLTYTVGS
ncbi:MAG: hypothetical protein JNM84_22885 [Planctomycetes bacterium]|nr:hypothetical protein [Planctomycetota bacterium]